MSDKTHPAAAPGRRCERCAKIELYADALERALDAIDEVEDEDGLDIYDVTGLDRTDTDRLRELLNELRYPIARPARPARQDGAA